jgi:hypothetical protein
MCAGFEFEEEVGSGNVVLLSDVSVALKLCDWGVNARTAVLRVMVRVFVRGSTARRLRCEFAASCTFLPSS